MPESLSAYRFLAKHQIIFFRWPNLMNVGVTIARSRNKWGDYITVEIAEGHNFIPFRMLVSAESEIITTFLSCCRCTITVDNADLEIPILVKYRNRPCKNGIKVPMDFKSFRGPTELV